MSQTEGSSRKIWIMSSLFVILIGGTIALSITLGAAFWYFSKDLPALVKVEDYRPLGVTRIWGKDTKNQQVLLAEFFKERRYLVPFDKLPKLVVEAFISAEDDQFFHHQGVNFASIARAALANLKAGQVVQGGSTITQQVAKSLLLTSERSLGRKFRELILSYRMEANLSKEQILYLYLNQIYLGHGAYGVEAAARAYFDKEISSLTLGEAALLAGLPQAPGRYSPLLTPKRAKERQLYVLKRMLEQRFITEAQHSEASTQSLKIFDERDNLIRAGHYVVEHVRRHLIDTYGEKSVYEQALDVRVPIQFDLAEASRRAVQEGLRAVDKRQGWRGPVERLEAEDAAEKFLRETRLALIKERLGHVLFLPDGTIDAVQAIKEAGYPGDIALLKKGQTTRALVTNVDDTKKTISVLMGAVRGQISLPGYSWALRGGTGPASSVVKPRDVIWVGVLEDGANKAVDAVLSVSLEQIPQVQGALVSIDARTGELLAMEGGYDFKLSEFNRAVQAMRQPGSAYKPLIYAAAMEKGFTPASIIVDSPIVYDDADSGKWKPANFEEKFYGDTTLRQALIKSRNVPTIKTVQSVTVPYLIEFSKRLGLDAQYNADLSISLGSMGVSLLSLTKAYAVFPRLGRKLDPLIVLQVSDRDGKLLEEHKPILWTAPAAGIGGTPPPEGPGLPVGEIAPNAGQVAHTVFYPPANDETAAMDPRVAYVMTHLMNEVVNYGTGQDAKGLGRPAAGKTGTTNDYIDAWFMGFTSDVVTGVWVGFDGQKPIGASETGARAALPIWLSFMKEAVKERPLADFAMPAGVTFASIDPATGKLAPSSSSRSIKEAFIDGTQPSGVLSSPMGTRPSDSSSDFLKEDQDQ
jgi:penicillin-binding protein 1A